MPVLRNIGVLYACKWAGGQDAVHPVQDAALVWQGPTIAWVGPESDLPVRYAGMSSYDAVGRLVVPGLIDCHTHLAFGGWRAQEFRQRLEGMTYQEIAGAGGGIMRTVADTRQASESKLVARSAELLAEQLALGTTTVECKSGYGLDIDNEVKLLRVYERLSGRQPVRIVATLLGAHVVPPLYSNRRDAYVRQLIDELIPYVAAERLARCCDVFVDDMAFTVREARQILGAAKHVGLAGKLHADQLTSCGGAELAAEMAAWSADHLECVSEEGIAALTASQVVAVSLPIAALYLQQAPMPARALIAAGVPVAVATDFNPGSAPSYHLPLALTLACTMQRMTPAEALKGCTIVAAKAIGLQGTIGSLEVGRVADFAVIDAADVDHWLYHFRANACQATVCGGELRWGRLDGLGRSDWVAARVPAFLN